MCLRNMTSLWGNNNNNNSSKPQMHIDMSIEKKKINDEKEYRSRHQRKKYSWNWWWIEAYHYIIAGGGIYCLIIVSRSDAIPSRLMGSFHTALLFVILVVLDRQIESHMRMDFLHNTQTQKRNLDLDQDDDMKERILCNILPRLVANHFMDPHRDNQVERWSASLSASMLLWDVN